MKTIEQLTSKQVAKSLDEHGFICVQILSYDECQMLLKWHKTNQHAAGDGFRVTLFSNNLPYRIEANKLIQQKLAKHVEKILPLYKPIVGNFVTKGSNTNSRVPIHQDWTFVDETKHRSLNIWCPLIDTNNDNGTLQVVPSSHHISAAKRGPGTPMGYNVSNDVENNHVKAIPLEAGCAIIYDHALLHGSNANQTDDERVAVTLSMAPKDAQLIHCQGGWTEDKEVIEIFNVDEDFYTTYLLGERPEAYKVASLTVVM